VLCFVQFNCTDKCPENAQYTYTKETTDGHKITLCVAEDYNALGYVTTRSQEQDLFALVDPCPPVSGMVKKICGKIFTT